MTPTEGPGPASGKLSVPSRLGYGLGDLGFLIVWQTVALFLLYYYTDVLGLAPWLAGGIFLVALVWDAVSDPVVAAWAERRAVRTGRYAPIMTGAALPVGISFALMFTAPFSGTVPAAAWALATHLAFRTAFTFASMPYNTLPARLTQNTDERSTLAGLRVAGAALGGLLAALVLPLVVQAAGAGREGLGYGLAALCAGGLAAGLLLACSRMVREPARAATGTPDTTPSLRADLAELSRSVGRNAPLRQLLALMACGTIGYGLFTHAMVYFLTHRLDRADLVAPTLALSALAVLVCAPLWSLLAQRLSKRSVLTAGLVVTTAGYAGLGVVPAGAPAGLFLTVGVIGGGSAAIPVMLWSMLPDAIDYGQSRSGRRVEARTFGLTTFVQKCAAGLTGLLAGGLLSLSGYVADTPPAGALAAITGMTAWLPAGFMLAGLAVMWGYPIDRARHRAILASITHSDA